MNLNGKKRAPQIKGGRIVTVTIRATPDDVANIDKLADKNGMSRAYFMLMCANAGYAALIKSGKMT